MESLYQRLFTSPRKQRFTTYTSSSEALLKRGGSPPSTAASSRLTVLTNSGISIVSLDQRQKKNQRPNQHELQQLTQQQQQQQQQQQEDQLQKQQQQQQQEQEQQQLELQQQQERKRQQYKDESMATQRELNLLLAAELAPVASQEDKKLAASQEAHVIACSRLSGLSGLVDTKQIDTVEDGDVPARVGRGRLWTQVLASVSVSIGSLVVGFSSAYTSPALASMKADTNSTITVDKQQESWIGSLMPLAALLGGVAGGPLIEAIGRKTTILATAIPFIISFLLIGLAVNVPMILAGRSIAGFCVGIASLCLPVYMGETVQAEVRGMLGLISTTFGNLGILLCYAIGNCLNWWKLALFGACLPVPFLVCTCFVPETPRWYISKNKNKRAHKALQWLRGKDADVTAELHEIEKNHLDSIKNAPASALDLFNRNNIKPITVSIGLMFFQQLSGINAVIFYTVDIFRDAGSTIDGNLSTIIVGIVNLGSTFIATALIDRLGRKVLLYISAISMNLSLLALGAFFFLKDTGYDVKDYGWLPLASFVIFVIGFSLGFGPIPWLMMGEILPAKIRGPAASIATAFNWACTFIVTKTFSDLKEAVGPYGAFWIFATICFFSLIFVKFCVPETQGKSLEDIERKFNGPVRRMSSIANLKPMPMAV
ncbi:facilitated trehalose transporter Tret1-like isoform X1 [Schistocerca nitens]|uniref:facilitated trehalose transporter Tret1-like isoform X1 n=1 Tax=Schistocerca nitens TaxID=7011 RepID=UPI002118D8E7|nr:facilitated trehalose transporter Tret1-like isoform X1 [Schistocerca nitens]